MRQQNPVVIRRLTLNEKMVESRVVKDQATGEVKSVQGLRNITLEVGNTWPGPDGHPLQIVQTDPNGNSRQVVTPVKIIGIFFVPGGSVSYARTDDDAMQEVVEAIRKAPTVEAALDLLEDYEEDAGREVVTEGVTPAEYEVWGSPDDDSVMAQTEETFCMRVARERVLFVEEVWPLKKAQHAFKQRLVDLGAYDDEEMGNNGAKPAQLPATT